MKKLFTLILVFVAALFFVACGHTHEFGDWVVVKEATEVEEGLKERTCECGEKESQTIDKLAHTHAFGEWVVVKEATEQEEGLKEKTCSCGEKETETIAKLEHVHKFENGSCACGEAHDCVYVDGKCECGKVEEIVYDYSKLLVGAGLEADTEVEGVKYYFGETAFATVNEALVKAAEGATIYVLAGEYPIIEAIEVNKPITFVGPNANKGVNDERAEEAMFTSDNYNTGSFFVGGANITFNGIGFKGVGEQGYPIQSREELENFTIKSCYFENVNTVFCPYDTTNFKGTFTIADTVNNNNLQFLAWIAGSAAELTKFEFTNNKVYGEVAGHFAAKGMISFRATDSNADVVIEGNEFDLEDYVLDSNPIYVASGKLSVKNNKFTGVAEAGLFFEGTVEAALEGNEFAALPTPVTISSIIAAEDGEFEVEAVVVAVNAQSFLIKDETGAMLVYKGKEWVQDVVVGDKVKVAGLTSVYGNAKQFGQDATYEKLETVEVVYEEAKALTAADVDAYAQLEKITPEYVTFSGKLTVSGGKYFNVAIEGATVIGSLTYPVDAEGLKALHGKEIVATGYVTGYVSNKYMNVIFTEVKEFTYTVSFKNVELEPVFVAKGGKLAKPADPVKEGATFVGWFADELLTTPYDFEAVVTNDLVLYAKFDGIKYSITYNLSGGKCDDLVNEFTNGAEVTLPTPTKEGNSFLGWFENGVKVEKLENKNYDLVARWEATKYTITYDLDGGTCYDLITEFKHDEDITLPTPSKDGFVFEGWFEGETKVEEVTNKNYELKAKWRQFVPCTVNYDLDGGMFTYGYQTSAEIGDAFFNDFVKYSNGTYANESEVKEPTKSLFQNQSHPSVKTSLANAEMLAKWNWLWKYMLVHLKEYNATQTSAYITDTYPVLEKMINGDTNAINENANARTSIRSYLHGLINSMKGCGDSNPTFAVYSPDFSDPDVQKGILINQYETTVQLEKGAELPVPVKDGYAFTGWFDANGNKVTTVSGDMSVKAKWEETIVVTSIAISNKIDSLELLKTYQLKWDITPADAINKLVKFSSSNEKVVTVSPEGLITAVGKGQATVTILSLSSSAKSDTFVINVVAPGYFDISYETNSYVGLGEEIKINAEYINGDNKEALTWTSLNSDIATVDANGKVTGVKAGTATIKVALTNNPNVYQEFVIAVLADDISDALQLVLDAHESNVFVKYELGIGAGTPNYYKDIFGSVSDFLYNEELVIDTTYNKATNEKYGDTLESRRMKSIEFVTVHYTAGFNPTAGGAAHGSYFAQPLSSNNTSIHYSTGNDGIFKGLDEQYKAAHAGDDGSFNTVPNGFEWIDTTVEVLESDPKFPVVTITSNATFAINGRDTGVKVPNETKFNRGYVTDSKWLNDQGIAVNVKDGKYQVGTTWWCYTQIAEGRICSNGGNANSIGIESAVNKGSDLWYTWQKTAKLVADIMIRYNLDITRVKGHHFFSAKDCPQPMLENDMEIWWKFIEMVEAEYEKAATLKDVTFELDTESDLLDEHGRVVKQNLFSEVVTYKVTIVTDDDIEEITLSSIIEGTYAK